MVRHTKSYRSGFTIIELLIVIVIIAILAAIVLVAYNGIQARAHASAAQADAAQLAKLLALSNVSNGTYPSDLSTINSGGPLPSSDGTTYAYHQQNSGANYCVTVTNATSSYMISDTNTTPTSGGCPGDGQGGQSAITNLSTNPSAEVSTSSFSGPNGTTVARSTAQAQSGSASVLVTLPAVAAGTGGVNTSVGSTIGSVLQANTTYTFSVWVYVPSSTVDVFLNAQGSVTSNACGSVITSTKNSWVRLSCQFTTTTSGAPALYVLNHAASTAGMQFYVDSVMVTQGSSLLNYADGNSPNWVWNGSANNSTSTGPAQ